MFFPKKQAERIVEDLLLEASYKMLNGTQDAESVTFTYTSETFNVPVEVQVKFRKGMFGFLHVEVNGSANMNANK